jgi:hypothetical protein
MSYNFTLQCGCIVYVACDPKTGVSHSRIVERRGPNCEFRHHEVGTRIYVWEMLVGVETKAQSSKLKVGK